MCVCDVMVCYLQVGRRIIKLAAVDGDGLDREIRYFIVNGLQSFLVHLSFICHFLHCFDTVCHRKDIWPVFKPPVSSVLGGVMVRWLDLWFKRSRVRLPAITLSPWASCSYTCASVTKQYSLVLVKGRWCPAAGKVTVGLASHWPCVTDFSGLSTYGLTAETGRWAPHLHSWWVMAHFAFLLQFPIHIHMPCRHFSILKSLI